MALANERLIELAQAGKRKRKAAKEAKQEVVEATEAVESAPVETPAAQPEQVVVVPPTVDMEDTPPESIKLKRFRKLVDYDEPMGSFFAKVPGSGATERFPSIVAYLARLIIHRYAQLGLLTSAGFPVVEMGVMVEVPGDTSNVLPVAA